MMSYWRMAFIFLPAAIRGDLGSLGLYIPVSVPSFWLPLMAAPAVRLRLSASRASERLQKAAKDRNEDVHFDWNAWCLPVRCLVVQAGRQVSSQFLYLVFRLPNAAMGIPFQRPHRTIRHLGRPSRVCDACAGPHVRVTPPGCPSRSLTRYRRWFWQGIDTLFVGFMFLQAVPEVIAACRTCFALI